LSSSVRSLDDRDVGVLILCLEFLEPQCFHHHPEGGAPIPVVNDPSISHCGVPHSCMVDHFHGSLCFSLIFELENME
jgi:hypothetical protein